MTAFYNSAKKDQEIDIEMPHNKLVLSQQKIQKRTVSGLTGTLK